MRHVQYMVHQTQTSHGAQLRMMRMETPFMVISATKSAQLKKKAAWQQMVESVNCPSSGMESIMRHVHYTVPLTQTSHRVQLKMMRMEIPLEDILVSATKSAQ